MRGFMTATWAFFASRCHAVADVRSTFLEKAVAIVNPNKDGAQR
jgi:hypothetical protein